MIRPPVVAGRFYESNKSSLLEQVEGCFSHNLGVGSQELEKSGRLVALISPHAGYMFSGPPASYGFARLKQEQVLPERIILLGPKHTRYGGNFSVSASSSWETPMGSVPVDTEFCREICQKVNGFALDEASHQLEHSLEVQLPFLQYVYKEKKMAIVPIAIGYNSFKELKTHFEDFRKFLGTKDLSRTLFIVSSDFSHDTPRELAYKLDSEVIEKILDLSAEGFYNLVVGDDRSVCGVMPITALLLLLGEKSIKAKLLKYSTSMDVMQHERGVGYASMSFEEVT